MAALYPFRALRPAPEAAARVASVPYDVVTADEARRLVDGNPLSFLRVTRAEVDLPPGIDPYDDRVYAQAVRNFEDLKRSAPLVIEPEPSLYLYRLRAGAHQQVGVAGCFSLDEYDANLIRKHELTRKDKEDDRTRHILHLRAQTGVVFLTYRASAAIDQLVAQETGAAPMFDFVAPDGVAHTLWRVRAAAPFVDAFAALPALYIADGHHRAASATRAREVLAGRAGRTIAAAEPASRFVAVAFPHDQVRILAYNRVVRDLAGFTPDAVLAALRARMPVREGRVPAVRRGVVEMFLAGRWYALELPAPPAGAPVAETLDVERLERDVLRPIFGIGDIRTDRRIDFVGGARGTADLERRVNTGDAAAAFAMAPVDIRDLLAIADAGGLMPPKSTWFEPKLRDGLVVHLV